MGKLLLFGTVDPDQPHPPPILAGEAVAIGYPEHHTARLLLLLGGRAGEGGRHGGKAQRQIATPWECRHDTKNNNICVL